MSAWKAILLVPIASAGALADFAEPMRVTDGNGQATQTATGLDVANNAYIASVLGERIGIRVIGPDLDVAVPMEGSGTGQGDPDFATTPGGKTYLCFSQLEEGGGGEGREIFLTWNGSAGFLAPVNVSKNRVDDSAPKLVLDDEGLPHITWAQRIQEETRVMYWRQSPLGESPVDAAPVAVGDYPALFVDSAGEVHIVYSRENDLYYREAAGGTFSGERPVTNTPTEPESSAAIGGDSFGNIVICYESRRSLYYATLDGQGFLTRFIDTGAIQDPRMRIRSLGQISIAYLKAGDIYQVTGVPAFLNQPEAIVVSPEIAESHPSLEIDLSGNLHLSFMRSGDVYYTTNAASPTAEFSADPTLGEVPLKVRFADLSNGDIQVWEWDFGDGGKSSEPYPEHTYNAPGKYTVSLRVVGPGAVESTEVKTDFIFVQTASNTLRVPNQKVFPGQEDVWFPFIASHREAVDAVTIMATYDPSILVFEELTIASSALASLNPDFIHVLDGGTFIEGAALIDVLEPIEFKDLEPGQNQTVWNAIFDVRQDAPVGAVTQLGLVNNRALSDVFNMFTIDGLSQFPLLTSSVVTVVERGESGLFLRGDTDGNGTLDITDAVKILNYLFLGGTPPVCEDASDVQDSGTVDISAAIALLNYLFLGGPSPSVPFPFPGLDPSEDPLTPCS